MPLTHEVIILTGNRAAAEYYSAPLLQRGYRVKWTSHEDRALAYIAYRNAHPDLVIIDHAPPIINGPVMLLAIKRLNPVVKVVMIGDDRYLRKFAYANGATDFIKRPVTVGKLLYVLGNHIDISGNVCGRPEIAYGHRISPHQLPVRTRQGSNSTFVPRARPRSRPHLALAFIIGLLVVTVGIAAPLSISAFADIPDSEAALVVNIHAEHVMELKNFTLQIQGHPEYNGHTGEGMYVCLIYHYVWQTLDPLVVGINLLVDSGVMEQSRSVSLEPGEIQVVTFYL
jgi:CheY-like chemotaxis protein